MTMSYLTLAQLLASAGIGTVTAFLLFRYLGEKWIESKFAERLEQLRHTHALELQRLRVHIDAMLSGAVKLQEKEFKVLPKAWVKGNDATAHISRLGSRLQRRVDVSRMDAADLREFLAKLNLSATEMAKINGATVATRNTIYDEIVFWRDLNDANVAVHNFGRFVHAYSVFLHPDLKLMFETLAEKLRHEVDVLATAEQSGDHALRMQAAHRIDTEIMPLREKLQASVYARLQSHAKQSLPIA